MSQLRVLSLSTLFPSPQRPAFGKFVEYQMKAVAARGDVDLVMVNPIGIPPWPLSRREPYRSLANNSASSGLNGVVVHHPRFQLIPRIGGDSNPARIVRAVMPLVRRLHAQHPFDLIDAQFFFPDGPAAARIANELGLPLSIKSRGGDILYWGGRPRALAQMRSAADQAAGLLAVSAALRQDMIGLGMPGQLITTHYTGLDHAQFYPRPRAAARAQIAALAEVAIPIDGPLLVATGALIAIKGQRLAIAALADLPGARLALAGKGEDEAALRALSQQLGLTERVHFLGQVSHEILPLLFSAADVAVLPSEREGLANAWVEAMACGAPLVIPAIGGAMEVVQSASAGRIAARNPAAIAAAVRELLATPPAQSAVAANAARFNWDSNAAELVAHWRRLAAGYTNVQ